MYDIELHQGQDPNSEHNTPEYWYGLTREAARELGEELPPSPPPSGRLIIEEREEYPPDLPQHWLNSAPGMAIASPGIL